MLKFLLGLSLAPGQRVALIQLDQLLATLTEVVLIFLELEDLVSPFTKYPDLSISECDELNQLGSGDATGKCETSSIGSPKYRNLKLKKKGTEEEKCWLRDYF